MIQGLLVELGSEKLLAQLTSRRDYHRRTEAIYRKQHAETEEEPSAVSARFFSKGSAGNIRERIKAAADQRASRAKYFAIFATHLIPNETYRLGEIEFRSTEMIED